MALCQGETLVYYYHCCLPPAETRSPGHVCTVCGPFTSRKLSMPSLSLSLELSTSISKQQLHTTPFCTQPLCYLRTAGRHSSCITDISTIIATDHWLEHPLPPHPPLSPQALGITRYHKTHWRGMEFHMLLKCALTLIVAAVFVRSQSKEPYYDDLDFQGKLCNNTLCMVLQVKH